MMHAHDGFQHSKHDMFWIYFYDAVRVCALAPRADDAHEGVRACPHVAFWGSGIAGSGFVWLGWVSRVRLSRVGLVGLGREDSCTY